MRTLGLRLLFLLTASGMSPLVAQELPSIVVSATAEVEVPPDRARLGIAVESRGRTAAEASGANARTQTAVIAAVRRAGIPEAQLRTSVISVSPVYEYPREGGRPTLVGYQARNGVDVEVRNLDRVSAVLDAAIAAGATNVDGPHFAVADDAEPRRLALEGAVKRARADADAMATAAGVRISAVLEVSTADSQQPPVEFARRMASSMAAEASTPVEAGRLTVRATVTIRFAITQDP